MAAAAAEAAEQQLAGFQKQEGELLARVAELDRQASQGQQAAGEQREALAALEAQVGVSGGL